MTINLENRFFYRLIKVLHYFSQGIFLLAGIFMLVTEFPSNEIPDNTKSYIVCDNGKTSTPVSNAKMEISDFYKDLEYSDEDRAKKFCATDSNGKVTDQVMQGILNGRLPSNAQLEKNYSLHIVYEPRDWSLYLNKIWLYLIWYAIFYVVTNIVRESLIYVAFGKKFDLLWAKIIINRLRVVCGVILRS